MKKSYLSKLILVSLLLLSCFSNAQEQAVAEAKINQEPLTEKPQMKTFLIEREIPKAGELTAEQLKGISQKSNEVLMQMGDGIQWIHSYVTENKVYCVYKAENKEAIKTHAENGGFPANIISELSTIIDPATAKD